MQSPRRSFLAELKRRHVYRVGVMYVAASFVVWQVADIVVGAFELPASAMRLVVVAAIVGFPIALILAWVYELTPAGIRRTADLDEEHATSAGPPPAAYASPGGRPLMRRMATAALAILVLLSGVWLVAGDRVFPGRVDPNELALAVFPFAVRGGGAVEYLREGAVDLLTRNFSGAGDLTVLDPALVLRAAGATERFEVSEAAGIARRIGAGQFVLGSVSQTGARIRIDATMYALRDTVQALPSVTVQGDTTQLFDLIDQLTAALLAEQSTGVATQRLVRTAATTTESLPALKLYLQGERHFRQGLHEEGVGFFSRAVEADTTFALARYRLAMSHHMRREHDAALREVRAALAHAERLNAHDRQVLDAFHALHAGRITDAESMLRSLVAEHPRDLEARLILAELLVAYSPLRAQPLTEARQHLETIIEADPQFACIYCQLAVVTMTEGDHVAAERWLRRAEGRRSGDTTRIYFGDQFNIGVLGQDAAHLRAARAALDTLGDAAYAGTVAGWSGVALMAGDFTLFDELFSAGTSARGSRAVNSGTAEYLRLYEDMARGRWSAASARAGRLAESSSAVGLAWHVLIHAPFEAPLLLDAPVREALLARLAELNRADAASATAADPARAAAATAANSAGAAAATAGNSAGAAAGSAVDRADAAAGPAADRADAAADRARTGAETRFLLALHASRGGDAAAARAWADSVAATAPVAGRHAAAVRNLAHIARADVLLRADDARGALRELDALTIDVPLPVLSGPAYNGGYAQVLRSYAHAAVGEHEQALRWLRHGSTWISLPLSMRYGTWHRDMAYALEALGRHDEARAHFARVAVAWSDADPPLRPHHAAALRRLGERGAP